MPEMQRIVVEVKEWTSAAEFLQLFAIAQAAPDRLVYPVEANEIFLKVSADQAAALRAQGFDFYDWGPGQIRLVTSWDQQGEPVERLAAAIRAL